LRGTWAPSLLATNDGTAAESGRRRHNGGVGVAAMVRRLERGERKMGWEELWRTMHEVLGAIYRAEDG
jgi:hypothetical protein